MNKLSKKKMVPKVAVIGAGKMGEGVIAGLLKSVFIVHKTFEPKKSLKTCNTLIKNHAIKGRQHLSTRE